MFPNCQIYDKGVEQETNVFKPHGGIMKDRRTDYTVYTSTDLPKDPKLSTEE